MEIRTDFNDRMSKLNNEIVKMGVLVEEALDKAMDSLINMDLDIARKVIDEDQKINDFEISIEDRCIVLIAREQPVAGDLRRIITALKISTQFERMGDHAVHIAKGVIRLDKDPKPSPLFGMPLMAQKAKSMLRRVLTAYIDRNAEEAMSVSQVDHEIDSLHDEVINDVFNELMITVSDHHKAITLLFINRFLERFGDHITNICEWIIYSVTGEHKELG